jgi:hypothetical protein
MHEEFAVVVVQNSNLATARIQIITNFAVNVYCHLRRR